MLDRFDDRGETLGSRQGLASLPIADERLIAGQAEGDAGGELIESPPLSPCAELFAKHASRVAVGAGAGVPAVDADFAGWWRGEDSERSYEQRPFRKLRAGFPRDDGADIDVEQARGLMLREPMLAAPRTELLRESVGANERERAGGGFGSGDIDGLIEAVQEIGERERARKAFGFLDVIDVKVERGAGFALGEAVLGAPVFEPESEIGGTHSGEMARAVI